MYTVLLVDDEALVREAISSNMAWEELGYELIGACKNGKEAMEFLKENRVDLVITDICMPFVDGLELSKFVFESYPDSRVIIISGYNEFEYAKKAVKYRVAEYVLKPVTMAELSEVLLNVRKTLFEEKIKKDSMKKLEVAYIKNLPILRTRYLNQMVNGIRKEELEEDIQLKLKELNISIEGKYYTGAIVMVEKTEEFLLMMPEAKKDLPAFIIFNILEEMLAASANNIVFQDLNNNTVILSGTESEEEHRQQFQKIFEECRGIVERNFGLGITIGIGKKVTALGKISRSYESAITALHYRFLYGVNRILDIRDFANRTSKNYDFNEEIKRLVTAIKINSANEINEILAEMKELSRKYLISQSRVYAVLQNLIVSVNHLLENANVLKENLEEKQEEILQRLYGEETLDDIDMVMGNYCLYIGELLSEQREGSGKKQAILAVEYIDKNYANPELTLQSICNDLAISTSYFSTIFKNYTGETFIEALTKKRMNKSMELLANTSMKIYEIAERVGFSDPHYFAITFKKYTGMTPKEYAKERRRE
ncbi:two-component system response regulator YesN [Mobilisporobacter senegalensis]|uniref:Stage 0 sporulation protein A homolog n=1 Tax=Mobilisporobacter senegalensis TaxID=1329262 RepID=A0A3N1XJX0_9FIRM|nr:response regulator [Mobilisporobacter senegalensis]ROR26378.1 two-component system response regulator YesN [Mobilisporobacter senegalensis]